MATDKLQLEGMLAYRTHGSFMRLLGCRFIGAQRRRPPEPQRRTLVDSCSKLWILFQSFGEADSTVRERFDEINSTDGNDVGAACDLTREELLRTLLSVVPDLTGLTMSGELGLSGRSVKEPVASCPEILGGASQRTIRQHVAIHPLLEAFSCCPITGRGEPAEGVDAGVEQDEELRVAAVFVEKLDGIECVPGEANWH